jgi:hypothetical protein
MVSVVMIINVYVTLDGRDRYVIQQYVMLSIVDPMDTVLAITLVHAINTTLVWQEDEDRD